jgi:hypothetical protein
MTTGGWQYEPEPKEPPRPRGNDKPRFVLTRMSEVEISNAPPCIVEDLIPREGLVVVWGPPKCGKTFVVYDMVGHIALGRPYGEREVEQGSIVYIAAEGEQGIKARTVAFRQKRANGEDPSFYLMTTNLDLVGDTDELIARIRDQLKDEKDPCKTIVIDTLNRSLRGSESKDEDMSAYVQAADRLREAFHCTIIIIHHCGTNGERPRGHTSLTGAIDAQISVKKDADSTILVELELMKDGPEGTMLRYRLIPVDVGIDTRGKPITSCVVEHLGQTGGSTKKQKPPMTSAMKTALRLLHDILARGEGETPKDGGNHIPPGTLCVNEDLWRRYCYQGGISTGEQDAKRVAFNRAVDRLVGDEIVGNWGDWYWRVGKP